MSLIVTASVDANYISYIDGLVNSMLHHHPNSKFLIRFINCDSSIIEEYENRGIQVIADTCDLDMKKNLVKDGSTINALLQKRTLAQARSRILYSKFQCYCTHIRFANVMHLLETTDSDILVVDADTIIRGDISELEHILETNHICTRYQDMHGGVEFDNEGLIGIKNCSINKKFWSIVLDRVTNNMFDWDSDSTALSEAYNNTKDDIKLYKLPPTFKDDTLNKDSLIWSGSFSIKDTASFKDELAKYLTK